MTQIPTSETSPRRVTETEARRANRAWWDANTESNDESLGSVGSSIEEVVGLWRELTGHEYGEQEPYGDADSGGQGMPPAGRSGPEVIAEHEPGFRGGRG